MKTKIYRAKEIRTWHLALRSKRATNEPEGRYSGATYGGIYTPQTTWGILHVFKVTARCRDSL